MFYVFVFILNHILKQVAKPVMVLANNPSMLLEVIVS